MTRRSKGRADKRHAAELVRQARNSETVSVITRIWRGWTTHENAMAYQSLLLHEIFPGIANRNVPGYRGISLVRRDQDTEVEFVTIMWFDSIAAVRAFAGDTYEIAVVPPKARTVLCRFEERSAHYETIAPPPLSVTA